MVAGMGGGEGWVVVELFQLYTGIWTMYCPLLPQLILPGLHIL